MSSSEEVVARLRAATDRLAAMIRENMDGLDAEIAAKFEPIVSELEAMGSDPADPVPEPEPTPDEPVSPDTPV